MNLFNPLVLPEKHYPLRRLNPCLVTHLFYGFIHLLITDDRKGQVVLKTHLLVLIQYGLTDVVKFNLNPIGCLLNHYQDMVREDVCSSYSIGDITCYSVTNLYRATLLKRQ